MDKKFKKDKEILAEFDGRQKDIRQQLNEQLKCLDLRLEAHLGMCWELQDFYRKRAEVEQDYSAKLDRLVKQTMTRHKTEKTKRELWPGFSTYTCWQTLLSSTKRQSRDHATLGELFQGQMCNRLMDSMDDLQRVFKKCREISGESHEEILKILNELQSAMKTYHAYHKEAKEAENKVKQAEDNKQQIQQLSSKGTVSKKYKQFEKQVEKKQLKYQENKLKALKARNEYILNLDATNAAVNKYYNEDLHNLIDCMDFGYHNTLQRALMTHISAEESCIKARQDCCEQLSKGVKNLDQRADKQRFLEIFNQPFALPRKFEFQAHKGDEICQLSAQKSVQEEMIERMKPLETRLNELRLTNDEAWKTLETAETSLLKMINVEDYNVSNLFNEENKPPKSPHEHYKKRSDRLETEAFYISKFKEFLVSSNLTARLQARYNSIQKALGEGSQGVVTARPPSLPPKPKKRRLGKAPLVGQPKLFGGSIEEYVEATKCEIPPIVKSCVKCINLHGMHHQGVFRVSGSQHEINDNKNSFEKGEDPLLEIIHAKDINSVAGVLKLYFRELREPLFPILLFEAFMDCLKYDNVPETVSAVKELIATLPRPILIVMRYLFSFLNHLSDFSDENMMEPYNLAVCFGPTLLPIPPDRDQVQFQGLVNDLMKTVIIHQEEIFPNDGGEVYEKCIITPDQVDNTSYSDEEEDDDDESEDVASEEEPDFMEATAQFDFPGRTERELSFKKGDRLLVFAQVSADWWEGSFQGRDGLIPDKYISIILREKDDERSVSSLDMERHRSTESLPAKPYSSVNALSDDSLDKCASQPNIAAAPAPPPTSSQSAQSLSRLNQTYPPANSRYVTAPPPPPTQSSSSSLHSSSSKGGVSPSDDSSGGGGGSYTVISDSNPLGDAPNTDDVGDLSKDLDKAFDEIVSSIHSLEIQQRSTKPPAVSHPKDTPDLVLDLPVTNEPPSPKSEHGDSESSSMLTTAEMFANNSQSTIKKGSKISSLKSNSMPTQYKGIPSSFHGGSGSVHGAPTLAITPTPLRLLHDYDTSSLKRSASAAGMRSRTLPVQTQPPQLPTETAPSRYSDPVSDSNSQVEIPKSVVQAQLALVIQQGMPPPKQPRSCTTTPDRPVLPKPISGEGYSTLPRASPDRPDKPKPLLKPKPSVKPKIGKTQVMKKPDEEDSSSA